jgi:hypothetical protein
MSSISGYLDVEHLHCCGGRELHGIGHYRYPEDAPQVIKELMQYCYETKERYDEDLKDYVSFQYFLCPAFVLFTQAATPTTDVTAPRYGDHLKKFIEDTGLGTVWVGPWNFNQNSGNNVQPFLWTVDTKAFAAYAEKLRAEAVKRPTKKSTAGLTFTTTTGIPF